MVPILHPLPHVTAHVAQTVPVPLLPTDRVGRAAAVLAEPRHIAHGVRPRVSIRLPPASRVLPLGFRRQTTTHPLRIRFGLVPVHTHHGTILASKARREVSILPLPLELHPAGPVQNMRHRACSRVDTGLVLTEGHLTPSHLEPGHPHRVHRLLVRATVVRPHRETAAGDAHPLEPRPTRADGAATGVLAPRVTRVSVRTQPRLRLAHLCRPHRPLVAPRLVLDPHLR